MNNVICVAFGKGGHQEQMKRLLRVLEKNMPTDVALVVFTDSTSRMVTSLPIIAEYRFKEVRDKYSLINTIKSLPITMIRQIYAAFRIYRKHNLIGFISTGPGVALIPALVFRLCGIKIIGFESWSRFNEPSLTGRVLSKFSHLFFVQNKSILKAYPKAKFKGRL